MIAIVKSFSESFVEAAWSRIGALWSRSSKATRHSTLSEFFELWYLPNVLEGDNDAQPSTVEDYRRSLRYWREATGNPALCKIDADKGEILREFDPSAEKIIMSPMLAGG